MLQYWLALSYVCTVCGTLFYLTLILIHYKTQCDEVSMKLKFSASLGSV